MKKIWQGMVILLGLAVGGQWAMTAHAEQVGYAVHVVKPHNQDDRQAGYFAVRVKPGQRDQVALVIKNQLATAQRFQVNVTQAVTNNAGVIDYSQLKPQLDSSLAVDMRRLFDRPQRTVRVAGHREQRVTFDYRVPTAPFKGILLGGVYVKRLTTAAPKTTGNLQIKNEFAYAVSIQMRENRRAVTPDLHLQQVKVTQVNHQNLVAARLQNALPGVMQRLTVQSKITPKNSQQVLLRRTQAGMGMAPNSHFDFGIPWGQHELKPGEYTLHMTANRGAQTWQFNRDFTVTRAQLRHLVPVSAPNNQGHGGLYVGLAVLIGLLLATIGYLIYRNHDLKRQRREE